MVVTVLYYYPPPHLIFLHTTPFTSLPYVHESLEQPLSWWLPITGVREGRKGEGGVTRILRGWRENADKVGMMQPSQQHVAPCVIGVE